MSEKNDIKLGLVLTDKEVRELMRKLSFDVGNSLITVRNFLEGSAKSQESDAKESESRFEVAKQVYSKVVDRFKKNIVLLQENTRYQDIDELLLAEKAVLENLERIFQSIFNREIEYSLKVFQENVQSKVGGLFEMVRKVEGLNLYKRYLSLVGDEERVSDPNYQVEES